MFSRSDAPLMRDSVMPADDRYQCPYNQPELTGLRIEADEDNGGTPR